jgi:hypothetical protein
MRHQPDGRYKWILHVGHFSKYTGLTPLKSKTAAEVAESIARILGVFEASRILQVIMKGIQRGITCPSAGVWDLSY